MVAMRLLALASQITGTHVAAAARDTTYAPLPGPPLRELAAKRGLLFGTDIHDTWPDPYKTDMLFKSIASRQFNFGNW